MPKEEREVGEVKQVEYPCTECGKDATIAYTASKKGDWGGLIKNGERICTVCFQKRGGKNFFERKSQ